MFVAEIRVGFDPLRTAEEQPHFSNFLTGHKIHKSCILAVHLHPAAPCILPTQSPHGTR